MVLAVYSALSFLYPGLGAWFWSQHTSTERDWTVPMVLVTIALLVAMVTVVPVVAPLAVVGLRLILSAALTVYRMSIGLLEPVIGLVGGTRARGR